MIRLAATAARLSIVEDAHSGVKETTDAGLIAVVGPRICDFHY